ncbi:MAG: class I SAM-dependent methyltransferase, partial [Anaerolineae bacterium]
MTACSSHHDAFLRPGKWVNDVTNRGERYLPLVNAYNAAMHLGHMASYQEALRYSYGRKVLDIGCGVGYGAFFLAAYGAGQVVGVDVSGNALAYARRVYHHPVLRYLQASALQLPFADQTFDFVFSSQVIEHVPSVAAFLAEVKRVLSPTGFCLITTPNKTLFTPLKTGNNPHHLNEMDLRTYAEYMRQAFPRIRLCGIPQNGLWLPPGQSIPVVKPNAEIRPQDFQIQHDNLEQCENLLCLGHKQAGGEFSAGLPAAYRPAANETAPLFWDSTAAAWAVMGLHPDNTP